MKEFWQGLSRGARLSLLAGVILIAFVASAAGYWALRTQDEVLFSSLSAQDAAAMTAELDRMKQPYRLGPDGTSILVDRDAVHRVRLKLMGKDLPLHGAVGFELFNNSDFGMTEFAQKVNYQRALQGEITRTILSLEEVASARVHLALPEERLFKNDQNRPKASITLGLHRGRMLSREQVSGIQRLVAAAVPGIAVNDVTITNLQGVALTRAEAVESDGVFQGEAVGLKADVENHLAHKAMAVLDRRFGAGAASISVDATLDMNRVRVTKEEVLGAPAGDEPLNAGVMVKERESIKDPAEGQREGGVTAASTITNRDVEYQVGRRVEQMVSQPGSVVKLQVAVVVRAAMDENQIEQARTLVAAAVGAVPARGDVVVVQVVSEPARVATEFPSPGLVTESSPRAVRSVDGLGGMVLQDPIPWMFAVVLLALGGVIALALRRRKRSAVLLPVYPPRLSEADRTEAMQKIQRWLAEPTSGPGRSA